MCDACGCSSENSAQVKLYVKGYSNSNVLDIEKSLLRLTGVSNVHIHAHNGQTTIDYNPVQTPLVQIHAVFMEYGLQAII